MAACFSGVALALVDLGFRVQGVLGKSLGFRFSLVFGPRNFMV